MKNVMMAMVFVMGIVAAGMLPVQADIVLNEDFTGVTAATFNDNGWFFGSSGGTVWQMSTYSTAPMSGDVLRNQGGTASNTKAYTQFPSFALAKEGDYIKVALNYRAQSTVAGTFAVSLLGFGATITANNLVSPAKMIPDAGNGYGTSHTLSTTPVAQKYGKYTNDGWPTSATLYTNSKTFPTDMNPHTYTLTLTKVATGVRLDSTTDATVFDSYIDTISPYTSFDTVRLFANAFTSGFLIDNITVETYVMPPKGTTLVIR